PGRRSRLLREASTGTTTASARPLQPASSSPPAYPPASCASARKGAGMRKLAVFLGFASLLFAAVAVAPSNATFPGTNGSLAYDAKIGKHYQLFTSNADGSEPQQLTHFADSDSVWAAWSPSGDQIAFERAVFTGVRVKRGAIYTMNADGTGLRSLTPTGLN